MLDMDNMLEEISQKDFNKQKFVDLALSTSKILDFIVKNMINHPHIMKYYHCFYILEELSLRKPELLYRYWDDIYKLLFHSNSYHRNFGLILLANITPVDEENKINDTIDDYLILLTDDKFMTAEVCVQNSIKIASIKPKLKERIISQLLNLENSKKYPDKQNALMMSGVIEALELIFDTYSDKDKIINFVRNHLKSISPKTRKRAENFLESHYE